MRSSVVVRSRPAFLARRALAVAIVPLLVAGCRSGGGAPAVPEEPMVTARVENNLVPAVALTVSLIPEQGERRVIGVVAASSTGELRFPIRGGTDPHRLLAEPPSGAGTVTRPFALTNASAIQWNVGRNALDVTTRP